MVPKSVLNFSRNALKTLFYNYECKVTLSTFASKLMLSCVTHSYGLLRSCFVETLVCHKTQITRLQSKFGVSSAALEWVRSYLSNRSQRSR